MRRKLLAQLTALACGIALSLIGFVITSTPALACTNYGCNNSDPSATGCSATAVNAAAVNGLNIYGYPNAGYLRARYSKGCQSQWTQIGYYTVYGVAPDGVYADLRTTNGVILEGIVGNGATTWYTGQMGAATAKYTSAGCMDTQNSNYNCEMVTA